MSISVEEVNKFGAAIIERGPNRYSKNRISNSFRSHFGCDPDIACLLWKMIQRRRKHGGHQTIKFSHCHHLLWALLFLKVYATEAVMCDMCGSDRKTFRKWRKIYVKEIARLAPQEVS